MKKFKYNWKHIIITCACFIAALFAVLPTTANEVEAASKETVTVEVTGKKFYKEANEVLKKINTKRKKQGLSSLKMDKEMQEIAMSHAVEMGGIVDCDSYKTATGEDLTDLNAKIFSVECSFIPGHMTSTSESIETQLYNYLTVATSVGYNNYLVERDMFPLVGIGLFADSTSNLGQHIYFCIFLGFEDDNYVPATKVTSETNTFKVKTLTSNLNLEIYMDEEATELTSGRIFHIRLASFSSNRQERTTIDNSSATWTSSAPETIKLANNNTELIGLKPGSAKITAKIGSAKGTFSISTVGYASGQESDDKEPEETVPEDFTGIHKDSDGKEYYYEDGKKYTGDHTDENGETYYYEDGQKFTGNHVDETDNTTYYYKEGQKFTGWKKTKGVTYRYKNGKKLTGNFKLKKNKKIYISKNKTLQLKAGKTYYFKMGKVLTGWRTENGISYYYKNGKKYTGELKITKKTKIYVAEDTVKTLKKGKTYTIVKGIVIA